MAKPEASDVIKRDVTYAPLHGLALHPGSLALEDLPTLPQRCLDVVLPAAGMLDWNTFQVKSSTTPRITRVILSAGYEWDVRFVFGLCDRSWRLLVLIAHSAQKTDISAPCCVALLCGVSSSCDCPQILPLDPPAWSESPTPL